MDFTPILERLTGSVQIGEGEARQTVDNITASVSRGETKILDFVKALDPVLTNNSYGIRSKGVEVLCDIIVRLGEEFLVTKEIEVLTEFLCQRFLDHKSMHKSALNCISYFVDCVNKPRRYNNTLLEFLKTKVNVQSLSSSDRLLVFSILEKIITQRHQVSDRIDGDLAYSVVHLIEGEGNPQNLLVCFGIVSYIMKNFQDLEPYIDDFFEWLSSYYPVDYTPSNQEKLEFKLSKADIVSALYECFFATPLNSENLQTLLLEKLDSSNLATKLESLECLQRCYRNFPIETTRNYISSIWTAIRMECLKKKNMVDHKLSASCHETLAILCDKLAQGSDQHMSFISDMYEELSIAFRKPEMDLFEPAASLLVSACKAQLKSFEYLMRHIVPISVKLINSGSSVAIMPLNHLFNELNSHYPQEVLSNDVVNLVGQLITCICKHLSRCERSFELLDSILFRKIKFEPRLMDTMIESLIASEGGKSSSTERLLASICYYYDRFDIIFDNFKTDCDIGVLLEAVKQIQPDKQATGIRKSMIYLHLVLKSLDKSSRNELSAINTDIIDRHLECLRDIGTSSTDDSLAIECIGKIHAIIFNKLNEEQLESILMKFVQSDFCLKIISTNRSLLPIIKNVFMFTVQWVLKALVERNHKMVVPFINLTLNVVSSEPTSSELFDAAVRIFEFVSGDNPIFNARKHYRIFAISRQKFFTLCKKEIKIRHDQEKDESKRGALVGCLLVQLPKLDSQIYRADHDWLLRSSLKVLQRIERFSQQSLVERLLAGLKVLAENGPDGKSSSLLDSLVNCSLDWAISGGSLQVRRAALNLLYELTLAADEKDLLILRPHVIDRLKNCLGDRKRLVRKAAAETRLKWILVGQPIGGG